MAEALIEKCALKGVHERLKWALSSIPKLFVCKR